MSTTIACTSPECYYEFTENNDFLNHLKCMHKDDSNYKCYGCKRSFVFVCRLKKHFNTCKSLLLNDKSVSNGGDENTNTESSIVGISEHNSNHSLENNSNENITLNQVPSKDYLRLNKEI